MYACEHAIPISRSWELAYSTFPRDNFQDRAYWGSEVLVPALSDLMPSREEPGVSGLTLNDLCAIDRELSDRRIFSRDQVGLRLCMPYRFGSGRPSFTE